jgi:hypothetical protein
MPPKGKPSAVSAGNFGGTASELPESDLPTHSDIARYFYLVSASEPDYRDQIHLVVKKLFSHWAKCNPRLPLMDKVRALSKLKIFLDKVKAYKRRGLKRASKETLVANKDTLFDISACRCKLPIVSCASKFIRCAVANCHTEHIACECQPQRRVPVEEREFLRTQRFRQGCVSGSRRAKMTHKSRSVLKCRMASFEI